MKPQTFLTSLALQTQLKLAASLLMILCAIPAVAQQVYYWTNDGPNEDWSTASNWSDNIVPGPTDEAIFDGATGNCIIDVSVAEVARLKTTQFFTGQILLGNNTLHIRKQLLIFEPSHIDACLGTLLLSGVDRIFVSADIEVANLVIDHPDVVESYSEIFVKELLDIQNSGGLFAASSNASFNCQGDVNTEDDDYLYLNTNSTVDVIFNSFSDQYVTGGGNLNDMVVAKLSGDVILQDDLYINGGRLAGFGGDIVNGGGVLVQGGTYFTRYDFDGTVEDMKFDCAAQAWIYKDLHITGSLEIAAVEYFRRAGSSGQGHLYVSGDVISIDQDYFVDDTGNNLFNTSIIYLDGTNPQTISGPGQLHRLVIDNIVSVTLADDLDMSKGGISGIGTLAGPGTGVNILSGGRFVWDFDGTIHDLSIDTGNDDVAFTSDVIVFTDLVIESTGRLVNQGGTYAITVFEDLVTNDAAFTSTGSNSLTDIVLGGNSDQTISGTGRLYDVTINKPSGGNVLVTNSDKAFQYLRLDAGEWQLDEVIEVDNYVMNGGVLFGSGTITGNNIYINDGTVSPGAPYGCFTLDGPVWFNSNATLRIEVDGSDVCDNYDQLIATSSVELGYATLDVDLVSAPCDPLTIINKTNATGLIDLFSGVSNNSVLTINGTDLGVNYFGGDGNDLTLTPLPCPAFCIVGSGSCFGSLPDALDAATDGDSILVDASLLDGPIEALQVSKDITVQLYASNLSDYPDSIALDSIAVSTAISHTWSGDLDIEIKARTVSSQTGSNVRFEGGIDVIVDSLNIDNAKLEFLNSGDGEVREFIATTGDVEFITNSTSKRAARTGRNPQTGESITFSGEGGWEMPDLVVDGNLELQNNTTQPLDLGLPEILDSATLRLNGDPYSAQDITFVGGFVELGAPLQVTGPASGGAQLSLQSGGPEGGLKDCPTCPPPSPGEPIEGVNISLEQIPGGTIYKPFTSNASDGYRYVPVLLSGINTNGLSTDPASASLAVIPEDDAQDVINLVLDNVPIEGRPSAPYSQVDIVNSVEVLDSTDTKREYSIDDMTLGFPTSALTVQGNSVSDPREFGIPVVANITSDGIDFYLATLSADSTLDGGTPVPSPGNHLAAISNVVPGSPFVIIGCPEDPNNSRRVITCKVPRRKPWNKKTKSVKKSRLILKLNKTSYCGPCEQDVDSTGRVVINEKERSDLDTLAQNVQFVESDKQSTEIKVYPNPTSGEIVIEFGGTEDKPVMVNVYTIVGQLVHRVISTSGDQQRIDLRSLPIESGMLIVELRTSEKSFTHKILYQR